MRASRVLVALLWCWFAVVARPTSAATITVLPGSQTVGLGGAVSVDVTIADLVANAAPALGGFDLDVAFDASILSFVDVTWGTGLDVLGLGSIQLVGPGAGLVNLFELSLDTPADLNDLQDDTFVLFTLLFQTVGTGTTAVGLSANALADADGAALTSDLVDAEITVVPEPVSLLLLSGGLLGVFTRRRYGRRV